MNGQVTSDAFSLTGTRQGEPEARRLECGRLSAELVNGNLRTVAWDGVEVLRAVAYLVRDRDWGTYEPTLRDLRIVSGPEGFLVSYAAACAGAAGNSLVLRATIVGTAAGSLSFEVTAEPEGDFETNRCGFCILHPVVGVAGARPSSSTRTAA